MAFACVAAFFAAAISSVAGEQIMARYKSDLFPRSQPHAPSEEQMRRLHDARLYSALLTFATTGGLLGLAMGLAGGLTRALGVSERPGGDTGARARHGDRRRHCMGPRADFLQAVRPKFELARGTATHPGRDLGRYRGR